MRFRFQLFGLFVSAILIVSVNPVFGIAYIPAVPDEKTSLSAQDGEPDGCNSSRFSCVMGGEAVLDKQTGLTWARNASIAGKKMSWKDATTFCNTFAISKRQGWRLPSRKQMISLLDTSQSSPALPEGHPFQNVGTIGCMYWTSTERKSDNDIVWIVKIHLGIVTESLKIFGAYAWPVRDRN